MIISAIECLCKQFGNYFSSHILLLLDVSLLCQFTTWTICYHLRCFAAWTLCHLDGSPPGRFDTRMFRYLSGCFTTCLKACNLWHCKNFHKSFFCVFNKSGLLSLTVSLSMYATALQMASVSCTNSERAAYATFCNRNALLKVQFGNYGRQKITENLYL